MENNDYLAVEILDVFTKTFCRDRTVADDLEFRCEDCAFSDGDNCKVKEFQIRIVPNFENFGSMVR